MAEEILRARDRKAAERLQCRREREQERRMEAITRHAQVRQEHNRERNRQRRATEPLEARQAIQERERERQCQRKLKFSRKKGPHATERQQLKFFRRERPGCNKSLETRAKMILSYV